MPGNFPCFFFLLKINFFFAQNYLRNAIRGLNGLHPGQASDIGLGCSQSSSADDNVATGGKRDKRETAAGINRTNLD